MRYLLVLVALAGCASTTDLLNEGHRFEFDSARAPRAAAHCITRNAEAQPLLRGATATMREGEKPGAFEVVVSIPLMGTTDAIVLVDPKGAGSTVKVFTFPGDKAKYSAIAEDYMRGCE